MVFEFSPAEKYSVMFFKGRSVNILIFIGVLVVGAGTIAGTIMMLFGQKADSDKSTQEIKDLSNENIRLSTELNKLNQEMVLTVTGGDSFVFVSPTTSFSGIYPIRFDLHHKGKYPVFDVSIRIFDWTCQKKIEAATLSEKIRGFSQKELTPDVIQRMKTDPKIIAQNQEYDRALMEEQRKCLITKENLGTITPNTVINILDPPLFTVPFPKERNDREYNIRIIARNGEISQKIKIDFPNDKGRIYSIVERVVSNAERVKVFEYELKEEYSFLPESLFQQRTENTPPQKSDENSK